MLFVLFLMYLRKKLRADIKQQYAGISEEQLAEIISTKEEMLTSKLETHSHETVIVYSIQKIPIFFQTEKIVYPTGIGQKLLYYFW